MLTQLLYVMGASVALFLFGANVAFLTQLGKVLTTWFTLKIVAITGIMFYMSLSLYIGDPGPWRASLALVFLLIDVVALGYMWLGIERMRSRGVTGLIPIARLEPNPGDE